MPIAAPLKPTGAKRGRPQSRTTPTGSAGRGLARLSGGDGQSNGRSAGDCVPGIANGDGRTLSALQQKSTAVMIKVPKMYPPPLPPRRHPPQEDQEDVRRVRLRQSLRR